AADRPAVAERDTDEVVQDVELGLRVVVLPEERVAEGGVEGRRSDDAVVQPQRSSLTERAAAALTEVSHRRAIRRLRHDRRLGVVEDAHAYLGPEPALRLPGLEGQR